MKKRHIIIIACVAVMALIICGIVFGPKIFETSPGNVTATPVPTEYAISTETPTLPPSVTPTPEPTPTETPVPADSPTPTPTEEVTPSPTEEPIPEPTEEPTPTEEPLPTDSPTPVPTNTATPVPTKEPTKEPTNTVTPVPTKEPTKEPTKAPTNTPTNAPTPTEVVVEQPITMWIAVDDFYVYDRDVYYSTNPHRMQKIDNQGKKRGDTVVVIRRNIEGTSSGYVDEIQWGSGTALVWEDHLSKTYIEPVWAEPRERTDVAQLLMEKVNAYRAQNGIRKFENPYTYHHDPAKTPADQLPTFGAGMGNYLTQKGLRVAKKCCMEGTANHEGGQIGTGIYGGYSSPANASEIAQRLFNNWYNSPAHNANMLTNSEPYDGVDVGVMTVVEWYNGTSYQYCAIMSHSSVQKIYLPDGLE